MQPVTYSLKCEKSNSEDYYRTVSLFTDVVIDQASTTVIPIVKEYVNFLKTYKLEELRKDEEYILELLSFGVLWRSYSGQALSVHLAPFIILAKMSEWRKKHQRIKPYIDFVRGVLLTLFMLPGEKRKSPEIPTLNQIDHVCKWFEATGEFREQALRFIRWRAYWGNKSEEELFRIFYLIDEFTDWFNVNSIKYLGKFTENVERFLSVSDKKYRWREDRISCTRSRIEYHLNMVGAELMNRAFRNEFLKAETKVVLVPGCMRGKTPEECKALKVKEGLLCNDCMPECKVNQLRKLGKRYTDKRSFDIYIIPHASDLSLWSPTDGLIRGVVASACVTTLVEGGWELKRYNVPAQCVLLDCSGCKKLWHSTGVPTMLNVRELKRKLCEEENTDEVKAKPIENKINGFSIS